MTSCAEEAMQKVKKTCEGGFCCVCVEAEIMTYCKCKKDFWIRMKCGPHTNDEIHNKCFLNQLISGRGRDYAAS